MLLLILLGLFATLLAGAIFGAGFYFLSPILTNDAFAPDMTISWLLGIALFVILRMIFGKN